MATQSGKNVYLTVTKESGNSVVLLFKMISTRAASGLYRAITETHAFYRSVLPLELSAAALLCRALIQCLSSQQSDCTSEILCKISFSLQPLISS